MTTQYYRKKEDPDDALIAEIAGGNHG